MLYVLWDLKLKVGHATRSVEECLREAHADMTIRTSLLEARFLFGDRDLFDDLEKRFDQEIVATTAAGSFKLVCAMCWLASLRCGMSTCAIGEIACR